MAGRRLLDAAILGNAARTIAKQHLKLRSQQLDTWNKTSTVAKAVKNQTDRVTLTVQAASALAQRFNELQRETYDYSNVQADSAKWQQSGNNKARDEPPPKTPGQDHTYERDEPEAASELNREAELDIKQAKASRYPTADGSIPPESAPIQTTSPLLSDQNVVLDRAEESQLENLSPPKNARSPKLDFRTLTQATDLKPTEEVASKIPSEEVIPEQEEVPEGINADIFHSPRVAELLGGKSKSAREIQGMGMRGAKDTPIDKAHMSDGQDQDIYNVRLSRSDSPKENENAIKVDEPKPTQTQSEQRHKQQASDDIHALAAEIAREAESATTEEAGDSRQSPSTPDSEASPHHMRESRVPSSRFGRLAQYGGLATSMVFGAVGETFRRATGFGSSGGSLMLSAGNMERLVAKLSRMRGAALKLGQMMSFQDSKMLPAPIHEVLLRVQDNADYMPPSQRDRVLSSNLGPEWRSLFSSFSEVPFAAASIGQVHQATLASSDVPVAVKIQYPGVATSISSDLSNLSILLTASRLLPKGLYLEKTIANAREELAWECDYDREAKCQERFRSLLADEPDIFTVPAIVHEASGPQVLTAEMMHGTAVTKSSLNLTQQERDWIGTQILRLCMRELTEFKFMQTDPNWTNFLFNRSTGKLELLDFGAARDFPDKFIEPYIGILDAAARGDRATVRDLSVQLGYLTGSESQRMEDAHVASVLTLAEPFRESGHEDGVYDFRDQTITDRVREQIPVMLRERLSPPPEETYSLHRRLSGSFLLLARLGSRVKCRELFVNAINEWKARKPANGSA